MKKSKLKKLIKETIKGLMNEQTSVLGHTDAVVTACGPNAGFTGSMPMHSSNRVIQCNGAQCTNADIGQEFTWTNLNNSYTGILDSFSNPINCTFHPTNCVWIAMTSSNTCSSPSTEWYCQHEINMAVNSTLPCCIPVPASGVPSPNFQTFATQQDCQNNTSCCNRGNQAGTLDPCCGGQEQGDPCTYNSWLNYYSATHRTAYCNAYCTNPNHMYYYPYCTCCNGCIDQTANNFNPGAVNDCAGSPGGTDYSCCTYKPVDEKGCLDPTALNSGDCCSGDPNCVPTINEKECCKYEHVLDNPCCEWCATYPNPITGNPPPGCEDWMCNDVQWLADHCPDIEPTNPDLPTDDRDELQRMQKLANIR